MLASVLATAPAAFGTVGWRPTDGPFPWADSDDARLAYSPSGEAYISAYHFVEGGSDNGAHVAVRPRGGAFARIATHPGDPNFLPLLDFDAAGAGTWATTSTTTPDASILAGPGPSPGSPAFGAVQTLGSGDAGGSGLNLAVNDAGRAIVPWRRKADGQLVVSERPSPSVAFGAPVTAAGDPVAGTFFGLSFSWAVLDADGGGAVIYLSDSSKVVLSAVYRDGAAGSFGGATPITPSAGIPLPEFAKNRAGDAVILWTEQGGFGESDVVKAIYRPHDGTFGAPEVVASNLGNVIDDLSVDVTGDGHVVFATGTNPTGVSCHMSTVVRRSPGASGTWTQDQYLGSPDAAKNFFPGSQPEVGASEGAGSDSFVLAWTTNGSTCQANTGARYVTAGFGHAAQAFSPPQVPAPPLPGATQTLGENTGDFDPVAAMDAVGNALVVWSYKDLSVTGMHAAAYEDGSSPPPPSGGPPPSGDPTPGGSPPGGSPPDGSPPGGLPPGSPGSGKTDIEKILDVGNKSQSVKKFSAIPVEVGCIKSGGDSICQFLINGRIVVAIERQNGDQRPERLVAARPKKKVTTFKIPRFRTSVRAGRHKTVKVPVTKKARKLAQTALKGGGSVKAVLTFRSGQATGKITRTIRIRLRKK